MSIAQENDYRWGAWINYVPGEPIEESIWHPDYVQECQLINRLWEKAGLQVNQAKQLIKEANPNQIVMIRTRFEKFAQTKHVSFSLLYTTVVVEANKRLYELMG